MSSAMTKNFLEPNDDFYLQAFENNPNALLLIDNTMRVLKTNAACEQLFQLNREMLVGKKLYFSLLSNDCYQHLLYNHRQRRINPTSIPSQYIIDLAFKDSTRLTLHIAVTLLPHNQSLVALINMESAQKLPPKAVHFEKTFEHEYSYIENLKTTSELAASVGHEIRNPMTSIRGFLQMMQKKPNIIIIKHFLI